MAEGSGPNAEPRPPTVEELDPWMRDPRYQVWMAEHVADLRRTVSGQRILYWTLGIGFVLGLALQVGGYLVRLTAPEEPIGLLADLVYTLGLALWTGIVVVLFVQVLPRAKQRQIERALDAYEALLKENAGQAAPSNRGG